MESFDYVESAEATERISIEGEEALVHHARIPNLDVQSFADCIHETAEGFDFGDDPLASAQGMLDDAPELLKRVYRLTDTAFGMEFYDTDEFDTDVERAISDTFEYFKFDPDAWRHARYEVEDPTTAEVIAAFVTLVNAAWCVNNLEASIRSQEDEDVALFSEGYFNAQVTQGLCTAFRDAFAYTAPKSPLQGMFFYERDHAIVDAIENTLGLELTDTQLHGLLLADWNQSVNLQAASQYGKQKSVEEGMNAMEGLVNAMEADDGES